MDQSTHDVRRTNWLNIVNQCQERPANVSVRQWLADNDIKEKAYYYWLRKFRKEAYNQTHAPTIVPPTEVSFAEISIPSAAPLQSTYAANFHPAAVIKCNSLTIEISNDISEVILSRILQEVVHA